MRSCPAFRGFSSGSKTARSRRRPGRWSASLGIDDVEIRRDDTIKDAWLEDNEALKTTYGLEEIQEYLERLVSRK